MNRRSFIKATVSSVLLSPFVRRFYAFAAVEGEMVYRTLGRTGQKVSVIGVGGAHIGNATVTDQEATRIIRTAIDQGVNFMDNSWDYHNGRSEERMGNALRDGYRDKVFLMTKIDGQTAKSATEQLDQSLQRLQVDHLDLLQFHEIIRMSDPERIFAPNGAMEAIQKAQKAGKLRFIGFTGHKSPEIHKHMIEVADAHHFTFDTVQMPLNVLDTHYDSFQKIVLPMARQRNMGVIGMKPLGDGLVLKSGAVTPVEGLRYAMSIPPDVTVTGIDSMRILDQDLNIAKGFRPLTQSEKLALLEKTTQAARNGQYELYKTTHRFDGTYQNPAYLG
jgi:predicted aldo/keto reductase-like oxidoreductase